MLFGEILVDMGLIESYRLDEVLKASERNGQRLGEFCIEQGIITEEHLVEVLTRQGFKEWRTPIDLDMGLLKRFNFAVLSEVGFIPIKLENKVCTVIVEDPINIRVGQEIKRVLPDIARIDKYVTTRAKIRKSLTDFHESHKEYLRKSYIEEIKYTGSNEDYIQAILETAVKEKSSDIHFGFDLEGNLKVDIRKYGILIEVSTLDRARANIFMRHLKQMLGMNPDLLVSQDGGATFDLKKTGDLINIRSSQVPTINTPSSDKIVLRLLGTSKDVLKMNKLGYLEEHLDYIKRVAKKGEGLNLFGGTTNSGKSTSIYSILDYINSGEKHIVTVEDPVEIKLDGFTQYRVNDKNKISNILRNIMRQDPDIIYVGEIRDTESAKVCIDFSLTGHGVWSSIHGKDSASILARLLDYGMTPLNISRTLNLIVYQKLVRVLCNDCKEELNLTDLTAYKQGKGCPSCEGLGVVGMTPIYELLEVTPSVVDLIASGQINQVQDNLKYTIAQSIKDKIDIVDYEEVYHYL